MRRLLMIGLLAIPPLAGELRVEVKQFPKSPATGELAPLAQMNWVEVVVMPEGVTVEGVAVVIDYVENGKRRSQLVETYDLFQDGFGNRYFRIVPVQRLVKVERVTVRAIGDGVVVEPE